MMAGLTGATRLKRSQQILLRKNIANPVVSTSLLITAIPTLIVFVNCQK